MVAADDNNDIMHPMIRPNLLQEDLEIYEDIKKALGIDTSLKDSDSYMQFMNYNQIFHLELLPMPPTLIYKETGNGMEWNQRNE